MFCHDDFADVEIYCVPRWVTIVKDGVAEHFFKKDNTQSGNRGNKAVGKRQEEREVPREVLCVRDVTEDIVLVMAMGFMVDDNDPAPEKYLIQEELIPVVHIKYGDGVELISRKFLEHQIIDQKSLD